MGIKNRLEGKLNRAQKEGRTEDAQHLEELLNELKRTRGDAAYARTLGGGYQVRAGDTAFSVAESELGDEALVAALLLANPGVDKLKKGMYLNLPDSETLAAYEALQQAEGRAGAAVGGASLDKLFPEIPPAPEEPETAEEDPMVDETVAGLLQLQQSDPALFNQLARLMDLPLAPANSADTARQAAFEAREARLETELNPPSQPGLSWEERQRLAAQKARSQAVATGTPGPTETATPFPTFEAIPAPEPDELPVATPNPSAQAFFRLAGPPACEDVGECPIKDLSLNWDDPVTHLQWYASGFFNENGKLRKAQGLTDLEAMAQIVEEAVRIYGDESWTTGIMEGLSEAFLGRPVDGILSLPAEALSRGGGSPESPYPFEDRGFHPDFRDGQNQIAHLWPIYSYNKILTQFRLFGGVVRKQSP